MICCNGLWSLTILNLRPYTYCQQWFTAQATASISRSRLQYLVSASIKLLDEKLTGLPSWSIHAPRPFWLASHSITISFCGSKYCNIVLSLTCLSSYTNSTFFFTRARRSCVLSARLGINFPRYLNIPSSDCSSCLFLGTANRFIPWIFFASGFNPSFIRVWPK